MKKEFICILILTILLFNIAYSASYTPEKMEELKDVVKKKAPNIAFWVLIIGGLFVLLILKFTGRFNIEQHLSGGRSRGRRPNNRQRPRR